MSQNPIVRSEPRDHSSGFRLRINKGIYKGAVYKLLANKITIGRSSESDICLAKDEKCSRKQAILILEPQGYIIKDLSGKASLRVNNIVQVHAKLQDGDMIHCGSTVLQFECPTSDSLLHSSASLPDQPLSVLPHSGEVGQAIGQPMTEGIEMMNTRPVTKKKSRKVHLILGAVLILVLWFLSDSSQSVDSSEDALTTKKDIERNIQTLSQLREKAEKKRTQNMSAHFKTAQFAYV